jgi:hypothetical protein
MEEPEVFSTRVSLDHSPPQNKGIQVKRQSKHFTHPQGTGMSLGLERQRIRGTEWGKVCMIKQFQLQVSLVGHCLSSGSLRVLEKLLSLSSLEGSNLVSMK